MLAQPVIDIDPNLLRRSADAQTHAFEQAWDHVTKERTGHIPTILDTLVKRGPWAWAIMPQVQADGSIVLPVHTTYEGIEEMYRLIRGHSDVLSAEPMVDVRGTWYSFQEDYARTRTKSTGEEQAHEMVLVLPVTSGNGITGELCWWRIEKDRLGKGVEAAEPKTPVDMRCHMLALHDRFLDALRGGDADGMVSGFSRGCQSAIRDYVEDTGTITGLDDLDELRAHYQRFFDLYQVQSASVLERVVQEWYLFAEVRLEVVARSGPAHGDLMAFHTASLLIPGREDKFIVQIGHGTDIAPVDVP